MKSNMAVHEKKRDRLGPATRRIFFDNSGNAFLWVLVSVSLILLLTVAISLFQNPGIQDGRDSTQKPLVQRFKIEIPQQQPLDVAPMVPADEAKESDKTIAPSETAPEPPTSETPSKGEELRIQPGIEPPKAAEGKENGAGSGDRTHDGEKLGNPAKAIEEEKEKPTETPSSEPIRGTENESAPTPPVAEGSKEEAPPETSVSIKPDLSKAPPPSAAPTPTEAKKAAAKESGSNRKVNEPAAPIAKTKPEPPTRVQPEAKAPIQPKPEPDVKSPEKPEPEKETVSVVVGNVRTKPSTNAGVAFQVHRGDTVAVLEKKEKWYHVQDDQNRTGWAHRQLFTPDDTVPIPEGSGHIIRLEITAGSMGGDILLFYLDQDLPPKTMVIEGDNPRIVCDFPDTTVDPELISSLKNLGETVKSIRSGIHGPPDPKVRVVMDLHPSANYAVRQIYDRANKRYILHILPKKETPEAG